MKITLPAVMLMALAAHGTAYAQLYKWVASDGKVSYSDTPPPKSATHVEQKRLDTGAAGADDNLPFELARAARNQPVTLYTGLKCDPCDEARAFLKKRGIPFKEKTVSTNEDLARLKQAAGGTSLPVMTIGRSKQTGFEGQAWGSALDAAGYPATSMLPKSYRYAPSQAAAPKPERPVASSGKPQVTQVDTPIERAPPAAGNAPPGFRF